MKQSFLFLNIQPKLSFQGDVSLLISQSSFCMYYFFNSLVTDSFRIEWLLSEQLRVRASVRPDCRAAHKDVEIKNDN